MKKFSWHQKFEELFGLDIRAMAFVRISFACLIITDLIQRSFNLTRDYTDYGMLPRSVFITNHSDAVSIHLMTGSVEGQAFLFIVAGVFALGMLIGYQTTICTLLSWLLLMSLDERNFFLLNGGDSYLRLLLFWGIFLPWGRIYSMDAFLSSKNNTPNTFSSLATFGFILQVCLLYFFAGTLKDSPQWNTGNALYYVLSAAEWTKPIGKLMLHYPAFLSILSPCIPLIEKSIPLLLIFPFFTPYFRILGVVLIISLHTGICAMMEVGLFSLICTAAAIGLLPTTFWNILPLPKLSNSDPIATITCYQLNKNIQKIWQIITYSLTLVLLTAVLVYIIFYNVSTLPHNNIKIPQGYKKFGNILCLNQYWGLFIQGKYSYSGWYLVEGNLKNGQKINAVTGEPFDLNTPEDILKIYDGERNRKMIGRISSPSYGRYRNYYARFLCREWNLSHAGNEQMKNIQAFYIKQIILSNNQKKAPEKRLFINYTCPKLP